MCKQLEILVVFAMITDFTSVYTSPSPQGIGQKAHFSLQNTPGSFTVHANKLLAKVSSKPDSIKVIVKPGIAEFPVPQHPTQKPLVHVVSPAVVRPVGGFNFMSFGRKRSKVETGKKRFGKKNKDEKLEGKNVKRSEVHSKTRTSAGESNKLRTNQSKERERKLFRSVDKVDGNNKRFGKNLFSRLGRKNTVGKSVKRGGSNTKTMPGIYSRVRKHSKPTTSEDIKVQPGERRELVKRKMKVQGGTGKFSVHVDKKVTKVSSSTGGVNVFIKNPSPKQISQLPQEMLQLPGAMLELPSGMSQLFTGMPPRPVSRFTKGISELPKENPWALIRLPHDWTGASNWQDDDN